MSKAKISLITIFDNPNFGTYLQTLALGVTLERLGAIVEIVHYERSHWQYWNSLKASFKGVNILHKMSRFVWSIFPFVQKRKEQRFVGRYLKISQLYNSYEELQKNPPIADIYLTGSDQVWNSIHNRGVDKSFYLGFAPDDKKKCAYAASIGMDEIPEYDKVQIIQLLKRYYIISVREDSNIKLLHNIGLDNVQLVLDPTLLLNKEEWLYFTRSKSRKKPYLLVYSVESKEQDDIISNIALKIAKERKLEIYGVYYSGIRKRIQCCNKNFYYASPETFLSLIANASFVVVSSFHGTAFSINMNKEFVTVTPKRFNSRINNLLSICDLSNRNIDSIKGLSYVLNNPIDYVAINEKMKYYRMKSINFIVDNILN